MKRWLALALLVMVVGLAWFGLRRGSKEVEVVRPRLQELAEVLALSGRIRGKEESRLAPEIQGNLSAILVQEGQSVKRSGPLFQIDPTRLKAQLEQARQRVQVAQAQLEVARRGPLPSQVEEVRAQVGAQRQTAAAGLESARQKLLEAQRGPRPEVIAQVRANLAEAKAEWEQRQRDALRQEKLFAEDAVSRQSLEQAQTLAKRGRDNWQSVAQRLHELERGTRPEQVEQARQAVRSAQAEVAQAEQAGQARLQQLLDQPRLEDVKLAEAQLQEARAAFQVAQEQLALATVRAPYDGVVGRRLLRVGDATGPSLPVVTFSSQPALEIRIDVDESDRSQLRKGLRAQVRAQGFGEGFEAEVSRLSSEVDSVRGTLEAYLEPKNAPAWAVPGQSVDVNLFLGEKSPRLLLPLTCVLQRGERREVVIVDKGKARFREVKISNPTEQGFLVRQGLTEKDRVVLAPQGLSEGQAVSAREI